MAGRSRRPQLPTHATSKQRPSRTTGKPHGFDRPLRFEPLEDRRLLSITVNTLVDENNGVGMGAGTSLREAIAAAPAGETINFSVAGTMNLTLGQLTISQNLTVTGPGATQLTINAGGASRVLEITSGTVGISGLTLTGGNADIGGGLRIDSPAITTLTGVAIQGNTATSGQYSTGGGIWNGGTLTITGSTISGNQAPNGGGGGVANSSSSLTIQESTISGNSAANGGGIFNYYIITETISLSTISGNSATFVGGGIRNRFFSSTTLSNTLITGNSAPTGSEISNSSGTVNLGAFNLIGDSSQTTAQALDNVAAGATDILATSNGAHPTALAAILAPLAKNSGLTKTHALVAGSPAIDAGNPGFTPPPNFDQRGGSFARFVGSAVDIGAYEVQGGSISFVVDTLVDESDGNYSAGDFSLREALALTNANPGADKVSFAAGLAGGTINLNPALGQLVISESVTVTGLGANQLTINAGGASRVLQITAGTVQVSGLTLTGGNADHGGGVRNDGPNTTLTGLIVQSNHATANPNGGGGLFNAGTITVQNSTISGNTSPDCGGIVNFYGATATITQSTISGNSTGGYGGALENHGVVTIAHSTITSNSAVNGGGIYNVLGTLGTVTVSNSLISGNTAQPSRASEIYSYGAFNLNAFNLIGDSSKTTDQALRGVAAGATDILATSNGADPTALAAILAPLANNGGPTLTRALVAGSPAIDAGNPASVAGSGGVPLFDQRGAPFGRVYDGDGVSGARIDIGAVERQPIPPAVFGDYNQNGIVDAADYTVWRDRLGQSGLTPFSSADGNGNGMVDAADYAVWRSHFGQTLPASAAGAGAASFVSGASLLEVSEPVAPAPAATAPRFSAASATVQDMSFATAQPTLLRHDSGSGAATQINVVQSATSDADQLLLLLAVDRVGRSPHPDFSLANDDRNDHDPDQDQVSLADEPLAAALAEWR